MDALQGALPYGPCLAMRVQGGIEETLSKLCLDLPMPSRGDSLKSYLLEEMGHSCMKKEARGTGSTMESQLLLSVPSLQLKVCWE